MRVEPARIAPGETLAQWRAVPHWERQRRQDERWSEGLVSDMPVSWASKLLERWRSTYAGGYVTANLEHLRSCRAIAGAARAGVKPDANDNELCEEAHQSARDMGRRLDLRDKITAGSVGEPVSPWTRDWHERCALLARWAEISHWLAERGLDDAAAGLLRLRTSGRALVARARCERWWRRILRRVHAKAVEATARAIGLVHKRAACYVSNEGMSQRTSQRLRNERVLEGVTATNEHGQSYTLAELAAKGPANREIRRHELMTRIAGFELIAKECGHAAVFVTVTCPGRMHRMKTAGSFRVVENRNWDGTAPDAAQKYLTGQWAKARAAAARQGVEWYGFRIAEPNHDGTPHWHLLLFVSTGDGDGQPDPVSGAVRVLRRYFLHDVDPDEPGADKHRVTVERIDWARGSAAGYIAKYVAKNIDGYRVEKDLYGNDAISSSQRVDAWASRWRVRQFQQIGGAPVSVWRELRRLHPEQAGASVAVELALDAVNITASAGEHESDAVQQYTAAHGWATYTHLQGGPRVPRCDLRLRVLRESSGECGRYGETLPGKAVGVERVEVRAVYRPAFGIIPATVSQETTRVQVESERSTWIVVPKGFGLGGGEVAATWSPVNNCTRTMEAKRGADPVLLAFAGIQRHKKRGRWATFVKRERVEGSNTLKGEHAKGN